ncbi:MAG: AAA family ATPase [Azonexus sp.]|nr:AAA family ATPase [Azonexus sp.]
MKSVAFFTNKGGVGKTTLVTNLAASLSLNNKKKILLIDADPQSNATQYMFDDEVIEQIYDDRAYETIYDFVKPVRIAKTLPDKIPKLRSKEFGVDVVLGDPRLALLEDFLASDWSGGDTRGLKTTFLFKRILEKCGDYDFVFFDMGPSLGSINRSVLLSSDYFVIPLSIDIFSVRAIENIVDWVKDWKKKLNAKLTFIENHEDLEVSSTEVQLDLLGYVSQQYTAKRDKGGERRAVRAFDRIKRSIPDALSKSGLDGVDGISEEYNFELGEIPNLHSLIPMSQSAHKPIFRLKSSDGVVGAHFSKVSEACEIYRSIGARFLENIEAHG